MTTYRTVAAFDSTPQEKAAANAICTGAHDESIINPLLGNDVELGFFSGHYNIQAMINAANFMNLVLKGDLSARLVRNYAGFLLRLAGSHGVRIEGLDFSATGYNRDILLRVQYSTDVEFINIKAHDCYDAIATTMNTGSPYTKAERIRVANSELYNVHHSGVNWSDGVDYAYVVNCHLHDFTLDTANYGGTANEIYGTGTTRPDAVRPGYLAEHIYIEDNLIERIIGHEVVESHGSNYTYWRRNIIRDCGSGSNNFYFHHNSNDGATPNVHDLYIEDNEIDGVKNGTIVSCEYPNTSISHVRIRRNKYRNWAPLSVSRAAICVSVESSATNGLISDIRIEENDIGPGDVGMYISANPVAQPLVVETYNNNDQSNRRIIGDNLINRPFPASYTNGITTLTESGPEEPPPTQHSVVVAVSPAGGGHTVPGAGAHPVDDGGYFSIEAIANSGYRFDRWEGDVDSGESFIGFTVASDMQIVAVFVPVTSPPGQFTVTVGISPLEGGTTDPAPGQYSVDEGEEFTIQAQPAPGWKFDHWGGDVSGSNPMLNIPAFNANMSIVAVFVETGTPPQGEDDSAMALAIIALIILLA